MIELTIIGNVGQNAVIRKVNNDWDVISFSVADTEKFTDANGVVNEKTTWVECGYFRPPGKTSVAQYLTAGSKIMARGKPVVEQYTDKNGQIQSKLKLRVDRLELLHAKEAATATQNPATPAKSQTPPVAPPPAPNEPGARLPTDENEFIAPF